MRSRLELPVISNKTNPKTLREAEASGSLMMSNIEKTIIEDIIDERGF
jgi:hypothetical protein